MDNSSWFGAWAPYNLKQNINPWELMWNPSGQLGLVNVTMKSSDPSMEREIVENIASYGRQLGKINEVMVVLLQHVSLPSLDQAERGAIENFQTMAAQIAALKATHGLPNEENINRLLDAIEYMKSHDNESYQRVTTRLRQVLDDSNKEPD